MTNRVEKYREARRYRRRYASLFFLFFFLLVSGILISDYSLNYLMNNETGLGIMSFENKDTYVAVSVLNYRMQINISYIRSDLEKAAEFIREILGTGQGL